MTDYLFGYPVFEKTNAEMGLPENIKASFTPLTDLHHPRNPDALAQFKRRAETVQPGDVVILHETYRDEYTISGRKVTKVNRDQIIIDTGCAYSRRTGSEVGFIGGGGSALLTQRWITIPSKKELAFASIYGEGA